MRVGAHIDQPRREILQLLRRRYFRHQHGVGLGRDGGFDVVDPPAGIEAVDPHHHFAVAEPAALQRFDDRLARGRLGVGSDGILQIENEAVGRQFARLLQRTRIRSRHVKHATPRPDGHRKSPFPLAVAG